MDGHKAQIDTEKEGGGMAMLTAVLWKRELWEEWKQGSKNKEKCLESKRNPGKAICQVKQSKIDQSNLVGQLIRNVKCLRLKEMVRSS